MAIGGPRRQLFPHAVQESHLRPLFRMWVGKKVSAPLAIISLGHIVLIICALLNYSDLDSREVRSSSRRREECHYLGKPQRDAVPRRQTRQSEEGRKLGGRLRSRRRRCLAEGRFHQCKFVGPNLSGCYYNSIIEKVYSF